MKHFAMNCAAAMLAVAGTVWMAGSASAECLIEGGGRSGVVQNNDFVEFGHSIPAQHAAHKGVYNDPEWSGKQLTVEPKGQCMVIMFGATGHMPVRKRTDVGTDKMAISCTCPT